MTYETIKKAWDDGILANAELVSQLAQVPQDSRTKTDFGPEVTHDVETFTISGGS